MRMTGKVAVVTGAARGIGLACARRFAQEGAALVVVDLPDSAGHEAAESLKALGTEALFVPCDAADKDETEAALSTIFAAFGDVDILVNNIGANRAVAFLDITEDYFDFIIRTNLKSVLFWSQGVSRRMIESGKGGAIINMASIAAAMSSTTIGAYSAAKGGVVSLTRSMALSLCPFGIRVNAIAPGTVETDMSRGRLLSDDKSRRRILSRTPMGRLGTPEDISGVAYFLASSDAAYVTGQTLYVDGGRMSLNYTVEDAD